MYEEFLRSVPLFADLDDADLALLCAAATELTLAAGESLFEEGSLADRAFVLRSGELVVTKRVGDRVVEVDRHDEPGTVVGEMALLEETTRLAGVRATRESHLLALGHEQVAALLQASPTAAQGILRTLTRRWRGLEAHVHHDERMSQLGTLAAGLAHELNNPAAALVRGAAGLDDSVHRLVEARVALEPLADSAVRAAVRAVEERVGGAWAERPDVDDALDVADREEALELWLAQRDVTGGWELSPALVAEGLDDAALLAVLDAVGRPVLPHVVSWAAAAASVRTLLADVQLGAEHVSQTVAAFKSYVYLDRAPVLDVDVHRGLDDTLFLLRTRLGHGVTVVRDYEPGLPLVTAVGGELNQVWTTVLDNAVEAVGTRGTVVVRTRADDGRVVVEVEDDGPGIATDHLPRVFDPFFTTKPPGSGAGLGLTVTYQIVQRHDGSISVDSRPGRTVVRIELPAAMPKVAP